MRITFLGTGTSHGIPVIGCDCRVCTSSDTRNHRHRTGIWLHDGNLSAVIDISSEFRLDCLAHGLTRLDFVLLTHAHSDHIAGLDDLRIFSQRTGRAMPLYGNAQTLEDIRHRFSYAFSAPREYGGGIPQYQTHEVKGAFRLGDWPITPLPVLHGPDAILGWRIGNFAMITDVTEIPESTLELLQGLDVLALDCLRRKPHSTHLHLEKSIEYARKIGARRTYMIHLAHDLEHAETESELPENCWVAYDGLSLDIT